MFLYEKISNGELVVIKRDDMMMLRGSHQGTRLFRALETFRPRRPCLPACPAQRLETFARLRALH